MRHLASSILIVALAAGPLFAQAGSIGVYSDTFGGDCLVDVTQPGVVSAYVLHTLTPGATGSRFAVPITFCPDGVVYLSETVHFPVYFGDTQTGIDVEYGQCTVGPIVIATLQLYSTGNAPPCCPLRVFPHPAAESGRVESIDCVGSVGWATGFQSAFDGSEIYDVCWCPYDAPPDIVHPYPADGATGVSIMPVLTWENIDPEGDVYDQRIYFGTSPDPPEIEPYWFALSYEPGPLSYNTQYYWQTEAIRYLHYPPHSTGPANWQRVQLGPIWTFTTTDAPVGTKVVTWSAIKALYR